MAISSTITIDMCIEELERLGAIMKKSYPDQVKESKLTPYERDHRYRVNEKLISLLKEAKANKQTNGETFIQLLNKQI